MILLAVHPLLLCNSGFLEVLKKSICPHQYAVSGGKHQILNVWLSSLLASVFGFILFVKLTVDFQLISVVNWRKLYVPWELFFNSLSRQPVKLCWNKQINCCLVWWRCCCMVWPVCITDAYNWIMCKYVDGIHIDVDISLHILLALHINCAEVVILLLLLAVPTGIQRCLIRVRTCYVDSVQLHEDNSGLSVWRQFVNVTYFDVS